MKVGVILPGNVPGVDGRTIQEWCRIADEGAFSSVAAADRLTYANLDPMQLLAFAAAATERVRVVSCIAIAPLRPAPIFAKQVATLSALAGGRFTLGIGTGARATDYEAAGVDFERKSPILTEQLEYLDRLRGLDDEQQVGPALGELEILIGGARPQSIERLLRWGDGYISGGIKPQFYGYEVAAVRGAWQESGKAGEPRIVAGTFWASESGYDRCVDAIDRYMEQGGPPPQIRDDIRRGEEGFRAAIEEFGEVGFDEIVFFPHVADVSEIERLAEIVEGVAAPAPA